MFAFSTTCYILTCHTHCIAFPHTLAQKCSDPDGTDIHRRDSSACWTHLSSCQYHTPGPTYDTWEVHQWTQHSRKWRGRQTFTKNLWPATLGEFSANFTRTRLALIHDSMLPVDSGDLKMGGSRPSFSSIRPWD